MQLNGNDQVGQRLEIGVVVGSVLEPLFTIFIDDINDEVLCEISKFADDTKLASRVNTLNDIRSVQRTLDKLVDCSNRRDMEFNVNKCGVMHKFK